MGKLCHVGKMYDTTEKVDPDPSPHCESFGNEPQHPHGVSVAFLREELSFRLMMNHSAARISKRDIPRSSWVELTWLT